MTFSNTNLEKLIQMATIEQMYSMLQKLKENVDYFNECNVEGKKHSKNTNITVNESVVTETLVTETLVTDTLVTDTLVTEIKTLHSEIRNIHDNLTKYNEHVLKLDTKITTHSKNVNTNIELVTEIQNIHNNLTKYNEHVLKLETKIEDLEKELHEIKSNTNNNSKFLCQQIRGQESLTSYPGFSNGNQKEQMVIKEEVHIKLKIEEKDINESTTSLCVLTNLVKDEKEDELELDEDEEKEDEEKEDELELDEDEEKEDDLDEEKEDEKDEESEEEVGTDDDESKNLNLEKEEEEEEEEEVFEIEIDDIPYFVTDEENGILYEVTSDGDIGKKVGIIKNGEPIFN